VSARVTGEPPRAGSEQVATRSSEPARAGRTRGFLHVDLADLRRAVRAAAGLGAHAPRTHSQRLRVFGQPAFASEIQLAQSLVRCVSVCLRPGAAAAVILDNVSCRFGTPKSDSEGRRGPPMPTAQPGEVEPSWDGEAEGLLRAVEPLVNGIAATLGPSCEVVLHDFRHPEHSIRALAGSLTSRHVGGAMSEIGLQVLAQGDAARDQLNYITRTGSGRTIKSSTMVLRTRSGQVAGALCVNLDISELRVAASSLLALIGTVPEPEATTVFSDDISKVVETVVAQEESRLGRVLPRDTRGGGCSTCPGRLRRSRRTSTFLAPPCTRTWPPCAARGRAGARRNDRAPNAECGVLNTLFPETADLLLTSSPGSQTVCLTLWGPDRESGSEWAIRPHVVGASPTACASSQCSTVENGSLHDCSTSRTEAFL